MTFEPLNDDWSGLIAALPDSSAETIGRKLGVSAIATGTVTTRTHRRTFKQANGNNPLDELLPKLPKAGETFHWLLDGTFQMGSVIPHVQRLIGEPCGITLATLGLNNATADELEQMLRDGRATGLRLAISSYFQSADKITAERITAQLKAAGASLAVERNHAKVQLYKPVNKPGRYVIETSSNLRSCNCIEIATITNDTALYDWQDGWLTQFFERNQI